MLLCLEVRYALTYTAYHWNNSVLIYLSLVLLLHDDGKVFHIKKSFYSCMKSQANSCMHCPIFCRVGVCFGVSSFSLQCRIRMCRLTAVQYTVLSNLH